MTLRVLAFLDAFDLGLHHQFCAVGRVLLLADDVGVEAAAL